MITGREGIKNYLRRAAGPSRFERNRHRGHQGGKQAIIINELPYQVNKAQLLETVADLVRDKNR